MKFHLSLMVLAAFAFTGVAHAHARLHKSDPADNSTITAVPKNLALEFNEAVKLTALSLQKGDEKAQQLGPLPTTAAKQITVAMPSVAPGSYIVKWRAMSDDNHIMAGKLLFTVAANPATK